MILIVDRQKRIAEYMASSFFYMGVLAYAATPKEALYEIDLRYRAVLIKDPSSLADPKDFVARLRSYCTTIPIFAISENGIYQDVFDGVFSTQDTAAHIAVSIVKKQSEADLPLLGDYRLAGIDASSGRSKCIYFFREIGLTATETMILRFLIRSYPTPQTTANILKYVFRPSKRPEPSSVRTHISKINRKFFLLEGESLVESVDGHGYRIKTPETQEAKLKAHTFY